MKLITEQIRNQLPPLYSQEDVQDPIAIVKFFTPWDNWTWYGIEFDGEDVFFGFVVGQESEYGYFSLRELSELTDTGGMKVERDKFWKPTRLSQIKLNLLFRNRELI